MRVYLYRVVLAASVAGIFVNSPTQAANAEFQSFFFDVCVNPTGDLATRCGETQGALGNLSGDSESSLNPSQGLSGNDAALGLAQTRSRDAQERNERLRDGESSAADDAMAVGPFSLMVHARGASFEFDRVVDVDAERGYDGDLLAAEIGFDYRVSENSVLGAIVGFERVDTDFDPENPGVNFSPAPNAGETEADTVAVTLFGAFNFTDNWYAQGTLGYSFTDYTFRRAVVFQESGRAVPQTNVLTTADTEGDSLWAGLSLGYDTQRDAWGLGAYGGLTIASSDIDGYTESDLSSSGLNMIVADLDRNSSLAYVGVRTNYAISTGNGVWIPSLRVEYVHDFDRDPQDMNTVYVLDANQTNYALLGDEPDEDYFNIALGVVGVLPNGWAPFLEVNAIVGNDDFDRTGVMLGVRKEL